jgi:hypothetical protein
MAFLHKTKLKEVGKFLSLFVLIFTWIFSGWPQIGNFPLKIEKAEAAAKTLYFRSTASTTVSGNSAVDQLSETAGSSNNTGTTIKHAKNVNTWQFIPDTSGNTTTYAIPSTPNSKGWIWDGSLPGSFANAQWTINVDVKDSSATGTAVIKAQVWKVTATSTAVTQVTNLSGILSSASFTPSTSESRKTLTFTPAAFLLDTGEYIYAEVYLQMTVAGGSSTGAMTKILDSSSGTLQGNIVTSDFTATVAPTVSTQDASNVEATTATGNGNISSNGGGTITEKGVCYMTGTSGDPTTADGTFHDHVDSTGAFTESMTGLSSGTNYRVRAYAVNSAGTGYGTTVQMLTKPAAPTGVGATDGDYADKVTVTWTKSTGATNYRVYRDGADVSSLLGDVATYDDTGADSPSITAGSAVATDGAHSDKVALSLSGSSFNNGTVHTYKVVASNATGASADSATNTGYRGIVNPSYQWQRSAADSDGSYSNIDGATTGTYDDTGAPSDGSGRYYRCLLDATGISQQTTATNRGFRGVISITLETGSGTVTYGLVASSKDTTGAENQTQTVKNSGNVAEDFDIRGQNSANWTLGASAGDATYKHEWCTSSCDSSPTWNVMTTTFDGGYFATNVSANDTRGFDLKITVPTSNPGENQQNVDVFVRAIQH